MASPNRIRATFPAPCGARCARARRALAFTGALLGLAIAAPASVLAERAPASGDAGLAGDAGFDEGLAPMGGIDRSDGLEAEAEFEAEESAGQIHDPDPWEDMNRGIFWFNERTDIYVLLPIAKTWRFVTPGIARTAIDNFNEQMVMPVIFANGVFQLKPKNAVQDLGRILYNATFGIAGFIDIATMVGIPQNDEDFGQTLGFWGAPPGPYLMLPFFGPSNIRDGIGRLGDTAATYYTSLLPIYVTFIVRGVEIMNLRARYIEEVDENRRESFDYYVFLRDAYLQNREVRVGRARQRFEPDAEEDLYYFDDEEDDDEEYEDHRDDAEEPADHAGDGSHPGSDTLDEGGSGSDGSSIDAD